MNTNTTPPKHLLSTEPLTVQDVAALFERAAHFLTVNRSAHKKQEALRGKTLVNIFFENSTRTRTSFELAGKRLGADVINMQVEHSAVKKGETLLDTAATLNAMHPDFICVRHPESGATQLLSQKVHCPVINAGDGAHEHPTQALLDAFTIYRKLSALHNSEELRPLFSNKVIAICGDILHSRVARSNVYLLRTLGAHVRLIAPPTLLPRQCEVLGASLYHNLKAGIRDADIVMMLRIQKERMSSCYFPSEREYFYLYGLDYEKLSLAKDAAFIMHPGPVNRGLEIDTDLADDIHKSVILEQVENGVAIRQAVLEMLAEPS